MRARDGRAATSSTIGVVLLAIGVLVAGCGSDDPAAACDVDVRSVDLQRQAARAGLPACTEGTGDADLPDVALPCLGHDGEAALASVQGPAVVNFWSSSCVPCVEEMPALARFDQEYGDQVDVLGVDFLDGYPAAAIDLARRSDVRYPSLADPCGALQETDLVVRNLPQFLFVRADGSVEQVAGGIDSVEEMADLAEQHLGISLEGAS